MSLLPTLKDFGGLDPDTGGLVSGQAHLRQSIRNILTTPMGSRVGRRTYGSRLFSMIDAPLNAGRSAQIVAAVAEALDAWEPRATLKKVDVVGLTTAGDFDLNLELALNGKTVRLAGVLQ
jgi:phage baseplate assembly protein W